VTESGVVGSDGLLADGDDRLDVLRRRDRDLDRADDGWIQETKDYERDDRAVRQPVDRQQ
jgi:hypothetical protein